MPPPPMMMMSPSRGGDDDDDDHVFVFCLVVSPALRGDGVYHRSNGQKGEGAGETPFPLWSCPRRVKEAGDSREEALWPRGVGVRMHAHMLACQGVLALGADSSNSSLSCLTPALSGRVWIPSLRKARCRLRHRASSVLPCPPTPFRLSDIYSLCTRDRWGGGGGSVALQLFCAQLRLNTVLASTLLCHAFTQVFLRGRLQ